MPNRNPNYTMYSSIDASATASYWMLRGRCVARHQILFISYYIIEGKQIEKNLVNLLIMKQAKWNHDHDQSYQVVAIHFPQAVQYFDFRELYDGTVFPVAHPLAYLR